MVRDRVREQDPLQGLKRSFLVQLIAERLSARQLILHRISASVCIYINIYVCATLRNAIILRAAHGVAGPFVAQFSRATSTRVG